MLVICFFFLAFSFSLSSSALRFIEGVGSFDNARVSKCTRSQGRRQEKIQGFTHCTQIYPPKLKISFRFLQGSQIHARFGKCHELTTTGTLMPCKPLQHQCKKHMAVQFPPKKNRKSNISKKICDCSQKFHQASRPVFTQCRCMKARMTDICTKAVQKVHASQIHKPPIFLGGGFW